MEDAEAESTQLRLREVYPSDRTNRLFELGVSKKTHCADFSQRGCEHQKITVQL
ncbi:MAG: hypothetical protein TR69_WS6001001122 [candidate division WS6 bacterium OLB20]|uniref:Uncharacterized protein n=1 Tax=candidate division WS6 bacterium OLB20 TaxID=1617426 RepID=A0A136LZP2_9BACT|nr:MAG: hypothetical protein TR69_WS6001001122 [candidate division WS6 bacterium OLB20]